MLCDLTEIALTSGLLLRRLDRLDILPEHLIDDLGDFHTLWFSAFLKMDPYPFIKIDRQV